MSGLVTSGGVQVPSERSPKVMKINILALGLWITFYAVPAHPQTPTVSHAGECSVAGTVLNGSTRDVIRGATVEFSPEGGRRNGATTDENGRFRIQNANCLPGVLSASRAGFLPSKDTRPSPSKDTDSKRNRWPPTTSISDIEIELNPAGSLAGEVADVESNPIPDAEVSLRRVGVKDGVQVLVDRQATRTNARGAFSFTSLPPGKYVACAHSASRTYPVGGGPAKVYTDACFPGSDDLNNALAISGVETRVGLTIAAVPALTLYGRVIGPPNMGSIRVELAKWPADPMRDHSFDETPYLMRFANFGVTNRDGAFTIEGLQPGIYRAQALLPGTAGHSAALFGETRIVLDQADVTDVIVQLAPLASLRGSVQHEVASSESSHATPPIQAVDVKIFDPDTHREFARSPAWSADKLNFTIQDIPAGRYTISISTPKPGGPWVKSATLNGNDIREGTISIAGITGPVKVSTSNEISQARIVVVDEEQRPTISQVILKPLTGRAIVLHTDPNDLSDTHVLPPGEYVVWAVPPNAEVPWADSQWMAANLGAGVPLPLTAGKTAALKLIRLSIR